MAPNPPAPTAPGTQGRASDSPGIKWEPLLSHKGAAETQQERAGKCECPAVAALRSFIHVTTTVRSCLCEDLGLQHGSRLLSSLKTHQISALLGQRLKIGKLAWFIPVGPGGPSVKVRKCSGGCKRFPCSQAGQWEREQEQPWSVTFLGGRRVLSEYSRVLWITAKRAITSSSVSACLFSSKCAQGYKHSRWL